MLPGAGVSSGSLFARGGVREYFQREEEIVSLIVQKCGGTSVADADRIRNVARIITETYRKGHSVVAVLSAQGDTTDDLIAKAQEINPKASRREMDMLLSTGEQISISLCAMAIEAIGYQAISLTGWQAGMRTDTHYSSARIRKINTERIQAELDKKKIVLVAGFQGINKYDDITTLGRGGSDTSAVALAAALHADLCQIYTDVDGVYTADPRHVKGARKLDAITFDEMLELASLGAQVLHNRSVEMAKRYNVDLEVLSSFSGNPGTKVKEVVKSMEKSYVSGIAKDKNVARLALVLPKAQGVRRIGAASVDLAYVAAGRQDAFYEMLLKPWDVAAGWLLVEEAGGRVTTLDGRPYTFGDEIMASNGLVHKELRHLLAAVTPVRAERRPA